jgi:hypothetical protein
VVAPETAEEPAALSDFLRYHADLALFAHDYRSRSLLKDLMAQFAALDMDEPAILRVAAAVRRGKEMVIADNDTTITNLTLLISDLRAFSKSGKRKMEATRTILYSELLHSFLAAKPDIMANFNAQKKLFCGNRCFFRDFFRLAAAALADFLQPNLGYALKGVRAHLHTFFMQSLPFSEFQAAHKRFAPTDVRFERYHLVFRSGALPNQALVSRVLEVCGSFDWFRSDANLLFLVPIAELNAARAVELPVEALARVVRFVNALRELLVMTNRADHSLETTVLYALMGVEMDSPFSFAKYLEFFLSGLDVLVDDEADFALFMKAMSMLANFWRERRTYYQISPNLTSAEFETIGRETGDAL